MSDDTAAWVAAGLLDPAAPDAEDRRQLLAYLASLGIGVDQMVDAVARHSLVSASTDQLLLTPTTYDLRAAAAAAGVGVDGARRVFTALGLAVPDDEEPAFDDGDVAVLTAFAGAMAFLGEAPVLAFLRVIGSSLARIAESADAMFLTEVEGPMRAGGGTSADVARSARGGLEMLLGMPAVIAPMFRRHVVGAVLRSRAARGGGLVDRFLVTVGFADLVDSTRLAAELDGPALAVALADLEREATDLATANGARIVKAIGDEVMVAAADPVAVVDVLVALAASVHAHAVLTEVRAAAAVGELQGRGGDWFGPEVHLASRAVREAPPGRVVVTTPLAEALVAAGRSCAPLGERVLRGVDQPVTLHLVGEAPRTRG